MAQNHMQTEETSYGGSGFEPFDFDETVEPDLYDGDYEMEVADAKCRLSNADEAGKQYPQIVLEWKALETYEESEECQRSVGNTVSEFITFRPKGDRKGNMSKQRLTALRNRFGIDSAVVPARPVSLDDYSDLCSAMKGQHTRMAAKNKIDNRGTNRTNLEFSGGATQPEETEAPPPPPKKAAATKAPAKGNGKKK